MIHIDGKNRQETKQLLNSIYKDVYNKKNQNGEKISFSQFNGMLENMSEEELQNIFYDFDKKCVNDITKLILKDILTLFNAYKYFTKQNDNESQEQCIDAIKALVEYEYVSELSDNTFEIGKSIYNNLKNKELKEFIDKEVLKNG